MRKLTALALFCSAAATYASTDIIYGEDNRHDVYTYPDKTVVSLTDSVVSLFKAESLTYNRETQLVSVRHSSAAANANFCSWERFSKQPVSAFCSGFLIAPDKIVTAGHCIQTKNDCENTFFIFGYKMANENQYYGNFGLDYVHGCKRILGQVKDNAGIDFAVIEIDRPTNRQPLRLSSNKNLNVNDEVLVIGSPSGLPIKIADNGYVRGIGRTRGVFSTNLDTYAGNSGSAVINARTLEVEGILVRGDTDFVTTSSGCRESKVVSMDGGRGEDVSFISKIHELGVFGDSTSITDDSTYRYIWFSWFKTCNEFRGSSFVREVEASYCAK